MALNLIDQILEVQPGLRILAVKTLRPSEQYLQDHFPRFPVMPGVLMLETLFQAASWLAAVTDDFRFALFLLKEVRNVRYADFVQPGQTLQVAAEIAEWGDRVATFKAHGSVGKATAVSGRLVLERLSVAERYPDRAGWEHEARRRLRERFAGLYQPAGGTVAT